jgi:hypothetical protein
VLDDVPGVVVQAPLPVEIVVFILIFYHYFIWK